MSKLSAAPALLSLQAVERGLHHKSFSLSPR